MKKSECCSVISCEFWHLTSVCKYELKSFTVVFMTASKVSPMIAKTKVGMCCMHSAHTDLWYISHSKSKKCPRICNLKNLTLSKGPRMVQWTPVLCLYLDLPSIIICQISFSCHVTTKQLLCPRNKGILGNNKKLSPRTRKLTLLLSIGSIFRCSPLFQQRVFKYVK